MSSLKSGDKLHPKLHPSNYNPERESPPLKNNPHAKPVTFCDQLKKPFHNAIFLNKIYIFEYTQAFLNRTETILIERLTKFNLYVNLLT